MVKTPSHQRLFYFNYNDATNVDEHRRLQCNSEYPLAARPSRRQAVVLLTVSARVSATVQDGFVDRRAVNFRVVRRKTARITSANSHPLLRILGSNVARHRKAVPRSCSVNVRSDR